MTARALVSSVLPLTLLESGADELAYAELYDDPPGLAPLPEEEPLIAKSVAKRRHEFITVRHCARRALGQLGVPPGPILKGDKGEPCWPHGVVGSLTHCKGYRGAVVGRAGAVRSVGIDAEPHDVLPDGVLGAIGLADERSEIAALPAGLHWDRILFCAKEATVKALGLRAVSLREIVVTGGIGNPPEIRLKGAAALSAGARANRISVSLTHERNIAAAVAVVGE